VFSVPALRNDIMIPAIIPPVVSIAKDLPGIIFFPFPADIILINVKPEIMQNGIRTRDVKTIPTRNDGVSPGFRKSRDNNNIRINEKSGPKEK
jgi:hypothetical protein